MKEMTYLQCSFCGWCRPIQYGGREVRFDKVDPENIKPFQGVPAKWTKNRRI